MGYPRRKAEKDMVQRVQVLLIDDVDASTAVETVVFALEGTTYEIDLSAENAQALRDDLAKWTAHARKQVGRKASAPAPAARGKGGRRGDLGKVREWARANGHAVSDRGRISSALQEAYDKAHA